MYSPPPPLPSWKVRGALLRFFLRGGGSVHRLYTEQVVVSWLEYVPHLLRKVRCLFTRAIFRATFAAISWRYSFLYSAATSCKDCGKAVINFNVVRNRKKSTTSKQTKTKKCRWKSFKRTKVVECAMLGYFILVFPLSLGSCQLHAKAMPTRRKYVEGRSWGEFGGWVHFRWVRVGT